MQKAFTLIELLVVVLIIGILAAIAVPQYQKAVIKSRYVQAMTLGNALMQAQQVYKMANNVYANEFDVLDIDMPAGKSSSTSTVKYYNWGYCALVQDTGEIDCETNKGLTFAASPTSGRRYCRWFHHDDGAAKSLKEKVCQNITGAAASSKDVNQAGFSQYKF